MIELKSTAFRRERQRTWRELEALLAKAEKSGLGSLHADELMRLPSLYRATLSGLSVARSISLDRNLLDYLEALSARAYFQVYASRTGIIAVIVDFFGRKFPASVRAASLPILVAAATMLVGGLIAYWTTLADKDWYDTFMPSSMAQGRTPTTPTEDLREILYHRPDTAEALNIFASFLFAHNARIGLLCFALGFAFGLPVLALLFHTGLFLGAFVALYADRGLGLELGAWLSIHGTTEILAVLLCGGAGFLLAQAILFPGPVGRLAALADRGRQAATIAIGAVALFFVAALLEGFGRQLIVDPGTRYMIGGAMLAGWLGYFAVAGRRAHG